MTLLQCITVPSAVILLHSSEYLSCEGCPLARTGSVPFNLALQLLVKAIERCCLAAENTSDIHSFAMKFPISSCPIETAETCILASPDNLSFYSQKH